MSIPITDKEEGYMHTTSKLAAVATAAVSLALLTGPTSVASDWTTDMRVTRPGGCTFYPSLDGTGKPLAAGAWTEPQKHWVGWRYRVNKNWTLVLDHDHHISGKPRWAFVETSCLKGNKYSDGAKDGQGRVRNLWGKASHNWRHVDFGTNHTAGSHTVGTRAVGPAYITMRDKPRAFVVANLFHDDKFKITKRCTSHSDHAWIYGLDLRSHRWGWVSSGALHGDPCLHMQ
ncbi:hypothetical protein AQI88_14255 [Streptomyces cellostaticus]|uniref:Uncharacterized protein n=1 Tax=Streptomyces cellostaticus TaxID=67285 RepID=A0A101NN20_9ACTN|nr:hypothetical protein [Streptomyces cellostaticus]KUM96012.1 hypothetical protein AQI88_14255 [Streptomyces cellostaticus]GHI02510.1 hypothetical protein Scel_08310 [Streptomyces cellostaticus]